MYSPLNQYDREEPIESSSDIAIAIELENLAEEEQTTGISQINCLSIFIYIIFFVLVGYIIVDFIRGMINSWI